MTKVNLEEDEAEIAKDNEKGEEIKAALLDDDNDLTEEFYNVLHSIFIRFSKEAQVQDVKAGGGKDAVKNDDQSSKISESKGMQKCILTDKELDNFAKAVNEGQVMSKESKDEIREFLDVDKDGQLTYAGFCEMYHLQSSSDPQETWKDLKLLGYNGRLELIDKC